MFGSSVRGICETTKLRSQQNEYFTPYCNKPNLNQRIKDQRNSDIYKKTRKLVYTNWLRQYITCTWAKLYLLILLNESSFHTRCSHFDIM